MNRAKKIIVLFVTMILVVSSFSMTIYAGDSRENSIATEEMPALANPQNDDSFFTKQPENQTVTVPDGATFHVEVIAQEDQCDFQWYFLDKEEQLFVLEGTSAKTPDLYIPSSEQGLENCKVFCEVTYNGETHTSNQALFTVNNDPSLDALLYVGNYVLKPGDSAINLADPTTYPGGDWEGTVPIGSGTISFSSDGSTVTFENVDMSNESMVFDTTTSPALGIMYRAWNNTRKQLHLELKGTNKVYNGFFQESTNGSGIPIDFYCIGAGVKPELVIEGDGTLDVEGGTYLIRHNGDISVKSDLVLRGVEDHFCDGIHSEISDTESNTTVTVCDGVSIDADINGTCIFAQKKINICPGSQLKIKSGIPSVGAGDSSKNVIYSGGINIRSAYVDIDMYYDPDRFNTDPYDYKVAAGFAGISSAREDMIIDNSNIDINITAGSLKPSPDIYAYYGVGIDVVKDQDIRINQSKINITMDSPDVYTGKGISCGGNLSITDSTVGSSMKSLSEAYSIYVNKDIDIKDSTVIAEADAYPFEDDFEVIEKSRGLLSNGGHIRISEKTPEFYVSATSADGIAFGSDFKDDAEAPAAFDPSYKAEYIELLNGCKIVTPEGGMISTTSRKNRTRTYFVSETVYDPADTSQEASRVIIRKVEPPVNTGDDNSIILCSVISILALVGVCSVYVNRRKTNK